MSRGEQTQTVGTKSGSKPVLNPSQVAWVKRVMGPKAVGAPSSGEETTELNKAENWGAREEEKKRRLSVMRKELDVVKDDVRMGMSFAVMVPGLLPGTSKLIKTLDESGFKNVQKQLDTEHHKDEIQKQKDPEFDKKVQRANKANEKLMKIKQDFTADFEGEPLFTDAEIMHEFYNPLVREAVVPENFVPARWNETYQTVQGASSSWNEKLEQESSRVHVKEGLALGKRAVGRATLLATMITDAVGAPPVVELGVSLAGTLAEGLFGTAEALVAEDVEGVFNTLGDLIGTMVGDAIGQPAIGKLITASFVAASSSKKIVDNLTGDPPNYEAAILNMVDVVSVGLDATCQASGIDDLQKWGGVAGKAMKSGVNTGIIIKRLADGDQEGAMDLLLVELQSTFQDQVELIPEGLAQTLAGGGSDLMGTTLEAREEYKQLVENLQKATEAKEAEKMQAELDEFSDSLCMSVGIGLTPDDADAMQLQADYYKIDKLMAQMARDQALLKVAEAAFDTGMKTAAQFFEPLQIATAGKDFVKNLVLAARRTQELVQWISLRKDAINAASVQGFAFANHCRNLKIEISDKTLNMVFELGKIAGGALSIAGAAGYGAGAIAGVVVSKVSTGAQILKDIIKDVAEEAECKRQWLLYKKCLANPGDLILVRSAIHGNATLAKYAMAYAAVELNDPIAKMGMQYAGLNEETLRHPDTNVTKVVEYLTMKWDYERQVSGSLKSPESDKWRITPIELTLVNWSANKQSAEEHAELDPESGKTSAIDGALVDFIQRVGDFGHRMDTAFEPASQQVAECRELQKPAAALSSSQSQQELAKSPVPKSRQRFKEVLDGMELPLAEGDDPIKAPKKRQIALTIARDRLLQDLARQIEADEACVGAGQLLLPARDQISEALDKAAQQVAALQTEGQNAVFAGERLTGLLRSYQPVTIGSGIRHKEFREYADELILQVEMENQSTAARAQRLAALTEQIETMRGQLPDADDIQETISAMERDKQEAELEREQTLKATAQSDSNVPAPLELPEFAFEATVWRTLVQAASTSGIELGQTDLGAAITTAQDSFSEWEKQRDGASRAQKKEPAQSALTIVVESAAEIGGNVNDKRVVKFVARFGAEAQKKLDKIENVSTESSGPDWVPPGLKSMPMTEGAWVKLRDEAAKSKGFHIPRSVKLQDLLKSFEKHDGVWNEVLQAKLPESAEEKTKQKAIQALKNAKDKLGDSLVNLIKALKAWEPRYSESKAKNKDPHPGMTKYRDEMIKRAEGRLQPLDSQLEEALRKLGA